MFKKINYIGMLLLVMQGTTLSMQVTRVLRAVTLPKISRSWSVLFVNESMVITRSLQTIERRLEEQNKLLQDLRNESQDLRNESTVITRSLQDLRDESTIITRSLQTTERRLEEQNKRLQDLHERVLKARTVDANKYDWEMAKIEMKCKILAANLADHQENWMLMKVDNLARR